MRRAPDVDPWHLHACAQAPVHRNTYTHAHTNTVFIECSIYMYAGACAQEHVYMCTHKHCIHSMQSSHSLKEYFFQSNTEHLLEAVLSVTQPRRNTEHRCPFRLVGSCGTRNQTCLLSLFSGADAQAGEPRKPAAQSPSGQQGAEFIPEFICKIACSAVPTFTVCPLGTHTLHPSPLA